MIPQRPGADRQRGPRDYGWALYFAYGVVLQGLGAWFAITELGAPWGWLLATGLISIAGVLVFWIVECLRPPG
jgi:hypothetical protein